MSVKGAPEHNRAQTKPCAYFIEHICSLVQHYSNANVINAVLHQAIDTALQSGETQGEEYVFCSVSVHVITSQGKVADAYLLDVLWNWSPVQLEHCLVSELRTQQMKEQMKMLITCVQSDYWCLSHVSQCLILVVLNLYWET